MALHADLRQFDDLANQIGGASALMLCAFFGQVGRNLYVPPSIGGDHLIARLIGAEAAGWLAAERGGETITLPSLKALESIKAAGTIAALQRHQVPVGLLAGLTDLSTRRVEQIRDQLRLEGLADLLVDDEINTEEV